MGSLEFFLLIASVMQLVVLLSLLYFKMPSAFANFSWLKRLKTQKNSRRGGKFYECSVRPRLLTKVQYNLPILGFCILFIIYDVDLIFFMPMVTSTALWSSTNLSFFGLVLALFGLALWLDLKKFGALWDK